MHSTTVPSTEWLKVVRRATETTDGTREAVADAIRIALRAKPGAIMLATAYAEALAELTEYAAAPVDEAAAAVILDRGGEMDGGDAKGSSEFDDGTRSGRPCKHV